jgi:hypothetical protein
VGIVVAKAPESHGGREGGKMQRGRNREGSRGDILRRADDQILQRRKKDESSITMGPEASDSNSDAVTPFINPSIHLFQKYTSSICHQPGAITGARAATVNKTR